MSDSLESRQGAAGLESRPDYLPDHLARKFVLEPRRLFANLGMKLFIGTALDHR